MVGVFASLKWRLVSGRIRAVHGAKKAWLIVGWVVAGALVLVVAAGLGALHWAPDWAPLVVATVFTLQFVSWGLAPLVAFGVDETIDPAKFALLPLRRSTLQQGLLTASLIGYLPVINMVLLLGAAVAMSPTWAVLPVALLCCAVQLVLCVVFSRALSTAMSGLMSGRRGRDLGVMLGFVLFVIYMAVSLLFSNTGGDNGQQVASGFGTVSSYLGWGPPGALALIPGLVVDGRWARLLIAVLTVVIALAVLWWWWAVALERSLTTVPSTTTSSAPAHASGSRTSASSTRGMMLLVAGRDRLLAWRDPMRRVPWLMVAFLALIWPFVVIRGHGALFAVAFPALLAGAAGGNSYGVEGSALWLHIVAFSDRMRARGEALGHALAAILPGAVIVVVACIVQAAFHDDWDLLPAGLGLAFASLLGGAATAGYLSARLPYAMAQSRKSMFASSVPNQKGRTAGASLLMMLGGILTAVPAGVFALLAILGDRSWGWVALAVGPIVGVLLLAVLTARTATLYLERTPEILSIVSAGDRI